MNGETPAEEFASLSRRYMAGDGSVLIWNLIKFSVTAFDDYFQFVRALIERDDSSSAVLTALDNLPNKSLSADQHARLISFLEDRASQPGCRGPLRDGVGLALEHELYNLDANDPLFARAVALACTFMKSGGSEGRKAIFFFVAGWSDDKQEAKAAIVETAIKHLSAVEDLARLARLMAERYTPDERRFEQIIRLSARCHDHDYSLVWGAQQNEAFATDLLRSHVKSPPIDRLRAAVGAGERPGDAAFKMLLDWPKK